MNQRTWGLGRAEQTVLVGFLLLVLVATIAPMARAAAQFDLSHSWNMPGSAAVGSTVANNAASPVHVFIAVNDSYGQEGTRSNVTFTTRAINGRIESVPTECSGPGSKIDRTYWNNGTAHTTQTLTCNLGSVAYGSAVRVSVPVVANAWSGRTLQVDSTIPGATDPAALTRTITAAVGGDLRMNYSAPYTPALEYNARTEIPVPVSIAVPSNGSGLGPQASFILSLGNVAGAGVANNLAPTKCDSRGVSAMSGWPAPQAHDANVTCTFTPYGTGGNKWRVAVSGFNTEMEQSANYDNTGKALPSNPTYLASFVVVLQNSGNLFTSTALGSKFAFFARADSATIQTPDGVSIADSSTANNLQNLEFVLGATRSAAWSRKTPSDMSFNGRMVGSEWDYNARVLYGHTWLPYVTDTTNSAAPRGQGQDMMACLIIPTGTTVGHGGYAYFNTPAGAAVTVEYIVSGSSPTGAAGHDCGDQFSWTTARYAPQSYNGVHDIMRELGKPAMSDARANAWALQHLRWLNTDPGPGGDPAYIRIKYKGVDVNPAHLYEEMGGVTYLAVPQKMRNNVDDTRIWMVGGTKRGTEPFYNSNAAPVVRSIGGVAPTTITELRDVLIQTGFHVGAEATFEPAKATINQDVDLRLRWDNIATATGSAAAVDVTATLPAGLSYQGMTSGAAPTTVTTSGGVTTLFWDNRYPSRGGNQQVVVKTRPTQLKNMTATLTAVKNNRPTDSALTGDVATSSSTLSVLDSGATDVTLTSGTGERATTYAAGASGRWISKVTNNDSRTQPVMDQILTLPKNGAYESAFAADYTIDTVTRNSGTIYYSTTSSPNPDPGASINGGVGTPSSRWSTTKPAKPTQIRLVSTNVPTSSSRTLTVDFTPTGAVTTGDKLVAVTQSRATLTDLMTNAWTVANLTAVDNVKVDIAQDDKKQALGSNAAVTYTVTVKNAGTSPVTNPVVTATNVKGLTTTRTFSNHTQGAGTSYVWNVGSLAPGQTATATLTGSVASTAYTGADQGITMGASLADSKCSSISNAQVNTGVDADTDGCDLDSDIEQSNLKVDVDATATSPTPGGALRYTVTVRNEGPDAASGVNVYHGGIGDVTSSTWTLRTAAATLAAGAQTSFTITSGTTFASNYDTRLGEVFAHANVYSSWTPAKTRPTTVSQLLAGCVANGTVAADTDRCDYDKAASNIDLKVDLKQTDKTVGLGDGDPVAYTVTVRNAGTTPASNVVITSAGVDGVDFDHYGTPTSGTTSGAGWNTGVINPGATVTIAMVGKVNQDAFAGTSKQIRMGIRSNYATCTNPASGQVNDVVGTDVDGCDTETDVEESDLKVDVAVADTPITPGGAHKYVVTYRNEGPDTASDVTIRSGTHGPGNPDGVDKLVIGDVAAGTAGTRTVTFTVPASFDSNTDKVLSHVTVQNPWNSAAGMNLFPDTDFNDTYASWGKDGAGISKFGLAAQNGTYGTPPMDMAAGTTFRVGWTDTRSGSTTNGRFGVYVQRRSASTGAWVQWQSLGHSATSGDFQGSLTLPAGYDGIRLGFYTESDMPTTTKVRISDVWVYAGSPADTNQFRDTNMDDPYTLWAKDGDGIRKTGTGTQNGTYYQSTAFAVEPGDKIQGGFTDTRSGTTTTGRTAMYLQRQVASTGAWVWYTTGAVAYAGGGTVRGSLLTVPADTSAVRMGFYTETDMPATTVARISDVWMHRNTPAGGCVPNGDVASDTDRCDYDVKTPVTDVKVDITQNSKTIALGAGKAVTYTVTVKNAGVDTATGVVVTPETLKGLTGGTWSAMQAGTIAGGNWTVGNVAPGQTRTATLTATVAADAYTTSVDGIDMGVKLNTATCSSITAGQANTGVDADTDGCDRDSDTEQPNLKVSINTAATVAGPGSPLKYTVTVRNEGPDAASGVYINHGGLGAVNSATYTNVLAAAELAAGAETTVTVPSGAIISSLYSPDDDLFAHTNVHSNWVNAKTRPTTVAALLAGCVPNSSAAADTDRCDYAAVEGDTDIRVDIAQNDKKVALGAGKVISYTVTVRNAGDETANVTATATAIKGLTVGAWTVPAGTTASAATWTAGVMQPGQTLTATVTGTVTTAAYNTASDGINMGVRLNTADCTNPATGQVNVGVDADTDGCDSDSDLEESNLKVDVVFGSVKPAPGVTVPFTITYRNEGPDAASGVMVHRGGFGAGTNNNSAAVQAVSELAAGAQGTITGSFTVPAGYDTNTDDVYAQASIYSNWTNHRNVTSVANLLASCVANSTVAADTDRCDYVTHTPDNKVGLDITQSNKTIALGANKAVQYKVTVKNTGIHPTSNVRVTPEAVTGIVVDDWTAVPSGTFDGTTWVVGALQPGESATGYFIGRVAAAAYTGSSKGITMGARLSTATCTSMSAAQTNTTADADTDGCDTDSDTEESNLKVDVYFSSGAVVPGQPLNYVVAYRNDGPDAASGVNLRHGSLGTGTPGTATVTSAGAELAPGTTHVVQGSFIVAAGFDPDVDRIVTQATISSNWVTTTPRTTLTSLAGVQQNVTVADDTDRTDWAERNVNTDVRVDIKQGSKAVALGAGKAVAYTVTVHNANADAAPGVVVTPHTVKGLESGTWSGLPAGTSTAAGVWNIGTLNPGQTVTATLTGTVTADAYANTVKGITMGVRLNSAKCAATMAGAQVNASVTDDNDGCDLDSDTEESNLKVDLVFAAGAVIPGQDLEYTITYRNDGPDPASGVVLVPGTFGGGTPNQTGRVSIGEVPAGGTGTRKVTFTIPESYNSTTDTAQAHVNIRSNWQSTSVMNQYADTDFTGTFYTPWVKDGAGVKKAGVDRQHGNYFTAASFPVAPGDQISGGFTYATSGSTSTGTTTLYMQRRSASTGAWTFFGRAAAASTAGPATGAVFTVPADTDAIRPGFYTEATMPATTTAHVSDVWLYRNGAAGDCTPNGDVNSDTDRCDYDEKIPHIDLKVDIAQVDKTQALRAGKTVPYTVTVKNAGTDAATGVVVTPHPVKGVTVGTWAGLQSGTAATGGVWNVGTLAPGQTVTATMNGAVTSAAYTGSNKGITMGASLNTSKCDTISTAQINATVDGDSDGCDVDSDTEDSVLKADVKFRSDVVRPGERLYYDVTYRNEGPDTASLVFLNVGGLGTGTPGTGSNVSVATELAPGQDRTFSSSFFVNSDYVPTSNELFVQTVIFNNWNEKSRVLSVQQMLDECVQNSTVASDTDQCDWDQRIVDSKLQVTKTLTAGAVHAPGEVFTYQVQVRNVGPDPAIDTVVTENLVEGLASASFTTVGQGSSSGLVWTVGDIPANTTRTATVTAVAGAGSDTDAVTAMSWAKSGYSPRSNPAGVDTCQPNSTLTADTDMCAWVTSAEDSKLQVDLGPASFTAVTPGSNVSFVVTVTNTGTNAAANVTVTDKALAGFTNVRFSGVTTKVGDAATWLVGHLPAGTTRTATVTATVQANHPSTGALHNVVVVENARHPRPVSAITARSHVQPNTGPAADTDQADFEAVEFVKLTVTKTPDMSAPLRLSAGQSVNFDVTVRNTGNIASTGTVVRDVVFEGFTAATFTSSSAGTRSGAAWTVGTLAAGGQQTARVRATVTAAANPVTGLFNGAWVSSNQAPLTAPANRAACEADTTGQCAVASVVERSQLTLTKTAAGSETEPGLETAWTITVRNTGRDYATNTVVTDTPRNNLDKVVRWSTLPQGTATTAGVWTVGDVAPGQTLTTTVHTRTADTARAKTDAVNAAWVSSPANLYVPPTVFNQAACETSAQCDTDQVPVFRDATLTATVIFDNEPDNGECVLGEDCFPLEGVHVEYGPEQFTTDNTGKLSYFTRSGEPLPFSMDLPAWAIVTSARVNDAEVGDIPGSVDLGLGDVDLVVVVKTGEVMPPVEQVESWFESGVGPAQAGAAAHPLSGAEAKFEGVNR